MFYWVIKYLNWFRRIPAKFMSFLEMVYFSFWFPNLRNFTLGWLITNETTHLCIFFITVTIISTLGLFIITVDTEAYVFLDSSDSDFLTSVLRFLLIWVPAIYEATGKKINLKVSTWTLKKNQIINLTCVIITGDDKLFLSLFCPFTRDSRDETFLVQEKKLQCRDVWRFDERKAARKADESEFHFNICVRVPSKK